MGEGRWRLSDANIGGSDLAYLEEKAKAPLEQGLDFTDLRADDEFRLTSHA